MDKQNIYTILYNLYNLIQFHLKKEGTFDTSYNTDELRGHYAKWNKPNHKRTNIVWFHILDNHHQGMKSSSEKQKVKW